MAVTDRFYDGGYVIYPKVGSGNLVYTFNTFVGQEGKNNVSIKVTNGRQEMTTYGKYPTIFHVGSTSYKTFSLKTVMTSVIQSNIDDNNAYVDVILKSPYEQYIEFEKAVNANQEWVVLGSMDGAEYLCDIKITGVDFHQNAISHKAETQDYDNSWMCDNYTYMDYIELTIECVEIGTL